MLVMSVVGGGERLELLAFRGGVVPYFYIIRSRDFIIQPSSRRQLM